MAKTETKAVATKKSRLPKAVSTAVRAALDKKGMNVVVLDLRKAGGFTDYFVLVTGGNPRQIQAIADGIEETLRKELGEKPALVEGVERSEWVLLDYFNFVVHVFSRDCRSFYGLERLWGSAVRHEIEE
jgi:ribosome-associated protein